MSRYKVEVHRNDAVYLLGHVCVEATSPAAAERKVEIMLEEGDDLAYLQEVSSTPGEVTLKAKLDDTADSRVFQVEAVRRFLQGGSEVLAAAGLYAGQNLGIDADTVIADLRRIRAWLETRTLELDESPLTEAWFHLYGPVHGWTTADQETWRHSGGYLRVAKWVHFWTIAFNDDAMIPWKVQPTVGDLMAAVRAMATEPGVERIGSSLEFVFPKDYVPKPSTPEE